MRPRWTLHAYLLARVVPAFLAAAAFFALLFELIDLFANLVKYIQNDATAGQVFRVMALYLPRCLSLSLAPAMLFGAAYGFGALKTSNELIVVHGSRVSLAAFAVPVLAFAAAISFAGFWFEDAAALPLLRQKKEAGRVLIGQNVTFNNAEIALFNRKTGIVWTADYFDDAGAALSGVTAVRRGEGGAFVERVDARRARWNGDRWDFLDTRIWSRTGDGNIREEFAPSWSSPSYAEPPASFRKGRRDLEELKTTEALDYIRFLQSAGLPYRGALAETYERFTFAATPLVVALLSIGAGGRLRKNILLSSLLLSLLASTAYYVIRMVSLLLARLDLISPAVGAGAPVFFFLVLGILLFRTAHT